MQLTLAVQDRALADFAARLQRLGVDGKPVLAAALNTAGGAVRAMTIEAEARQTGLPERTLAKAQKPQAATPSSLDYAIRADGGDIRLKYFGATESASGVMARPLGEAKVFATAFMKGGRFPNRVSVSRLGGQVFVRTGAGRTPIKVVRSGVAIPTQMVTGATAAAFEKGVATIVSPTVVSRLGALLP